MREVAMVITWGLCDLPKAAAVGSTLIWDFQATKKWPYPERLRTGKVPELQAWIGVGWYNGCIPFSMQNVPDGYKTNINFFAYRCGMGVYTRRLYAATLECDADDGTEVTPLMAAADGGRDTSHKEG